MENPKARLLYADIRSTTKSLSVFDRKKKYAEKNLQKSNMKKN